MYSIFTHVVKLKKSRVPFQLHVNQLGKNCSNHSSRMHTVRNSSRLRGVATEAVSGGVYLFLGVYLVRGVYLVLGVYWFWGVYLLGVYLVLGGVPGPGGVYLPRGYLVWGVYLVPGGYLVPGLGGCTWSGGVPTQGVYLVTGVPAQVLPPVNRMTDRCKNITFATSLRTVKTLHGIAFSITCLIRLTFVLEKVNFCNILY